MTSNSIAVSMSLCMGDNEKIVHNRTPYLVEEISTYRRI